MSIDHDISLDAARDVATERARQKAAKPRGGEGWTPEHDDLHDLGEMALAAAAYAIPPHMRHDDPDNPSPPPMWPEDWEDWWKPKDRRRDLVRAGALILAEIERLDRAFVRQALRERRESSS